MLSRSNLLKSILAYIQTTPKFSVTILEETSQCIYNLINNIPKQYFVDNESASLLAQIMSHLFPMRHNVSETFNFGLTQAMGYFSNSVRIPHSAEAVIKMNAIEAVSHDLDFIIELPDIGKKESSQANSLL